MSGSKSVLMVLTSHEDLGDIRKTGYYVGEAAEPWKAFKDEGFTVTFASVQGGTPPQDGFDGDDELQREFLADPDVSAQLADTLALAEVDPANYDAVFFVGGHGTMWDFPNNPEINRVSRGIYEKGGVVSAVCHGPAALVGITLSDGTPLVRGRKVAGFTNDEEAEVGLTETVPFLLADELEKLGATHVPSEKFTENVITDGRLVTGQNPQSAAGVGRAVVAALSAASD